MNRIIKFRGNCIKSNDLVYGDLIHGVGSKDGNLYILPHKINLAGIKHCDPLDGVRIKPETLGQFTGLKDKDGTDIYEGDVLELANNEEVQVSFRTGKFVGLRKNGTISLTSFYWMYAKIVRNNIN